MKTLIKRFLYAFLAVGMICGSFMPQQSRTAQAAPNFQSGSYKVFLPNISTPPPNTSWVMAGANPERTSRVTEEVRGKLSPQWYRTFEPYIAPKVQIVTAFNNLYISTARGLYALNASNGTDRWVFPTELPLGHSPTVSGSVLYVGGMDKNLYALNANNGSLLWKFTAGAGFDTNPLVVEGKVFAGNRDGYMYAIYATGSNAGKLAWRYKTDGQIHYSAAYKEGVIYFASDDSRAYALRASDGGLVWRSEKLPGAGFHSWWPVVYNNTVVFAGSSGYRTLTPPGDVDWLAPLDRDYMFPNHLSLPEGTMIGSSRGGNWIDASKSADYFEQYPWRRTYFVLNRSNGQEVTFDTDSDGRREYAPVLWFGSHSGNRFPPLVGSDSTLYQSNLYSSAPYIARGGITGWRYGTDQISIPSAVRFAVDEPIAYAGGGNVIYYTLCCDRAAGAFDMSLPNDGTRDTRREWVYFEYNLPSLLPGYGERYNSSDLDAAFGGRNGVYGNHGDQNPPIPYNDMVFLHRSNTVIGFGPSQRTPVRVATARTVAVSKTPQPANDDELRHRLAEEIDKMIDAGHLRPGYGTTGNFDQAGRKDCGDNLVDYFANPADTILTLLLARPHITDATLRSRLDTYIRNEFNNYRPDDYLHVGWAQGASRDAFLMNPEIDSGRASFPRAQYTIFEPWNGYPPQMYYALWKYAQAGFANAGTLLDQSNDKLHRPPSNDVLARHPAVHNAFIMGYTGYVNLAQMAGRNPDWVDDELNRLKELRRTNFTKDSPYTERNSCKAMNVSQNFMYLTPELGDYLNANIRSRVQEAVTEYNNVAPYWFATRFEATYAEGVYQHLYDYQANFQARALILKEPAGELVKYLDAPAFAVGDLFYIQNLVYTIAAP